jgi:hypothetical protein
MTLTTDTTESPCGDSDILALPLSAGAHGSEFHGETCLVEKSNRIAFCIPAFREQFGAPERFTDDHPSISRVVRTMAIGLNDIPDAAWGGVEGRTAALDRFSVAILGTKTTVADEETRAWLATDWLIRVQTPAWLRLAGLTAEAQALEGLARVVDATTARAAQPTLDIARTHASAAGEAARAAAVDAARDAAWAAAVEAAWAAAWAAAWDAAWAAAVDAAWAAAWAAAGEAAWEAARDAAWDAARAAAREAAWAAAREAARAAAGEAAGEAARDAARAALAPTAATLRASAIELLDAMVAVGRSDQ